MESQTYSLHTDGAYNKIYNQAAIGGYLSDEQGNVLWKFSEPLTFDNPKMLNHHELLAIEHGLKKAVQGNVKKLKCFTDSQTLAHILNIQDPEFLQHYIDKQPLLTNVVELMKNMEEIAFFYIPRKDNKQADALTRLPSFKEERQDFPLHAPKYNARNHPIYASFKQLTKNPGEIDTSFVFHWVDNNKELYIYDVDTQDTPRIISQSRHQLGKNWMVEHLNLVEETLKNTTKENVAISFYPNGNSVHQIIEGNHPLSARVCLALDSLHPVIKNFSRISRKSNKEVMDYLFNRQKIDLEFAPLTPDLCLQAMAELASPEYRPGSKPEIEERFDLPEKKQGNAQEIQKKYFSHFLRFQIQQQTLLMKTQDIPIAKKHPKEQQQFLEQVKAEVTAKGIKLLF